MVFIDIWWLEEDPFFFLCRESGSFLGVIKWATRRSPFFSILSSSDRALKWLGGAGSVKVLDKWWNDCRKLHKNAIYTYIYRYTFTDGCYLQIVSYDIISWCQLCILSSWLFHNWCLLEETVCPAWRVMVGSGHTRLGTIHPQSSQSMDFVFAYGC